jgi:hypothetical protein
MTGGGHHQGVWRRGGAVRVRADRSPVGGAGHDCWSSWTASPIRRTWERSSGRPRCSEPGGWLLPKDRNVGVTPAVVRASSGAALHLPISQVVNLVRGLEQIKESGYWIVGLDAGAATRFQDLPAVEWVRARHRRGGSRDSSAGGPDVRFHGGDPVRGRVGTLNAGRGSRDRDPQIASRYPHRRWNPVWRLGSSPGTRGTRRLLTVFRSIAM